MNRVLFTLAGSVLHSSVSLGGGWTSSRGQISSDNTNPWFLENTSQVTYCVDIDEENFGVSRERATEVVTQAINDWKDGFKKTTENYYSDDELKPYGQLQLATQDFHLEECSEDTDLRFLLGKLSENKSELSLFNPHEFIGVAIRTHYSRKKMIGKGFIYLAPTKGYLHPAGAGMHEKAWSNWDNAALKVVLLHELGHVFGMQHEARGLMAGYLPKQAVAGFPNMGRHSVASFFSQESEISFEGCDRQVQEVQGFLHVFGLDRNGCGKLTFTIDRSRENREPEASFTFQYKKDKNGAFKTVAKSDLKAKGDYWSPRARVFLPEEQEVFWKSDKNEKFTWVYGEGESKYDFWGSITLTNDICGENCPAALPFRVYYGGYLRLDVVVDNEIRSL